MKASANRVMPFLHAGVAVGHRDRRATLRIALGKIEPGAKFYAAVDRKSDFATGHQLPFELETNDGQADLRRRCMDGRDSASGAGRPGDQGVELLVERFGCSA